MKKNVDFYIILFICVLACGILYFLCDHTDEYSVSKTGNVFALRGTEYGVSSPKGATNGNSWTSVGGSGQTTATSRVRVSAPSSARSHSQFQGSSYLPMISSPATQSSSRVSYSAFGGSAKGSATMGSSAKTMPTQSVAYRGLTQPLAYGGRTNAVSSNSQRSLLESSPTSYVSANVGNDAIRQSVRQSSTPSLVGSSSYTSVYAHNSRGLSVYGDYATIGEAMTSPYRANVQHRAPFVQELFEGHRPEVFHRNWCAMVMLLFQFSLLMLLIFYIQSDTIEQKDWKIGTSIEYGKVFFHC